MISKFLKLKPKFDNNFLDVKIYINDVRCILSDLNRYDINLIDNCGENYLVSHIVFNRLPHTFKQELSRKLGNNYPKLQDIFDNYAEVIKTINLNQTRLTEVKPPKNSGSFSRTSDSKPIFRTNFVSDGAANQRVKNCKFCNCNGHNMFSCKRYQKLDDRKARCVELGLCSKCSSSKHGSSNCRILDFACYLCKRNDHISALCPKLYSHVNTNFCINASADSGKTYILPSMFITIGSGNSKIKVRCLIDTGSQRSYLSRKVHDKIRSKATNKTRMLINTFLESEYKEFIETAIDVKFDGNSQFTMPFLISDDVDLTYQIDGLVTAYSNISKHFDLIDDLDSDVVHLEGLLGIDAIQYFQFYEVIPCLSGSAVKLANCIVPIGNVDSFLTESQLSEKYRTKNEKVDSSINSSFVNFVLNPIKTRFDPVGSIVSDSLVDDRLDDLFKVESLGITDNSQYDQHYLNEFDSNLSFENGKYEVKLPWTNNITNVKSNFDISKQILNRVIDKLIRDDLYSEYDAVLQQQLNDDIIEPIDLNKISYEDHVWIPHRPVIKQQDNVTTKLRIVLNCSLKIGNSPSLNEAAYPGIDLLSNMMELLIKIRNNKYFVMSDIKQAFLMIKIKTESDRNKFSILWKDTEGNLVGYRYKSIVFGFISSPFILNHVIKYHISKYDCDHVFQILDENLYVDNLFFTGSNNEFLSDLYTQTYERMKDGGFELRSWVTNNPRLSEQIAEDGSGTSHSQQYEKVLGYKYLPQSDEMALADCEDIPVGEVVTKRTILSVVSQIFDPLGQYLPVTVRGKILLQRLWKEKYGWDEAVSDDIRADWLKIKTEFSKLPNIPFPRQAYENECELLICCDASKDLYGFSCYAKSSINGKFETNLIFAKSKIAPVKSKSLPTLELLSAFLAIKCLPNILNGLKGRVTNVTLCLDAQIVLSWILTKNVKTKNLFASNRIKDITKYREEIFSNYSIDIKFKYIPTEFNPADLLTRGITHKSFVTNIEFWRHGPEFLNDSSIRWPEKELRCLSESSKILARSVIASKIETILPIDRFSDVNRLIRVTALVFKFIYMLKKKSKDQCELVNESKLYWLKHEQQTNFIDEYNFLNSSKTKNVPPRVNNLNLFLDSNDLIRSKGRLDKCLKLSPDQCNPVLLPKFSLYTKLIILDCHKNCKHLGVSSTISNIRKSGYWIPQIRSIVKSVLSKCILCKKMNSLAFKYPKPTNYFKPKVNFVKPFLHTGMDFTGHIFVKLGDSLVKMYLLVFTCLNIRAVHLELVPSMSCKDFLLAFVRFCNSCCIPECIYSDNASSFLLAMGIISKSHVDNDFTSYLVRNSIRHIKIPLYSAWVGSAWERMIRTIKSSLHKVIGRKHVDYFNLITVLSEIQHAINSRPLTYVDSDNLNIISPNSFLKFDTGRRILYGSMSGVELAAPSRAELVSTFETMEDMLDKMKDVWYDDYLLSLRENALDLYQETWENRVHPGEVVLISSFNKPRTLWQLGKITETITGGDGKIRFAKVLRPDGTEGEYAINLLYPLEISQELVESQDPEDCSPEYATSRRPKRAAAVKCLQRMKRSN